MIRNLLYIGFFSAALGACGTFTSTPAPVSEIRERSGSTPGKPEAPAVLPGARTMHPAYPVTGKSEGVLQTLLALGIDYRRGGSSVATGFDCSGLVAHVYQNAFNVKLPRLAKQQASSGRVIELAQIEAGDLLFYDTQGEPNSHVGIYIGDGRFVHAPRSGAKVRVERIESGYWRSRFNVARRIEVTASS